MTRVCKRCKIEKDLNSFSKERRGNLGRKGTCKECRKTRVAEIQKACYLKYKKQNNERCKKYKKDNADHIKEYSKAYGKKYWEENREELLISCRSYRQKNKEKILAGKREYYYLNQNEINTNNKKRYYNKRYGEDLGALFLQINQIADKLKKEEEK